MIIEGSSRAIHCRGERRLRSRGIPSNDTFPRHGEHYWVNTWDARSMREETPDTEEGSVLVHMHDECFPLQTDDRTGIPIADAGCGNAADDDARVWHRLRLHRPSKKILFVSASSGSVQIELPWRQRGMLFFNLFLNRRLRQNRFDVWIN